MNARKLVLPLLVALACVGAGLAGSATAAPQKAAKHSGHGSKELRIDSVDVASKAGPLSIRIAADIKTEVELKVNGRVVGHPFEQDGEDAQTIELSSGDNLHAGANRLSLTARRLGIVSRAKRSVKVPGWALRADAGADGDSVVHVRARLGTKPPLGAAGPPLDYRWRIVSRPEGANATLSNTGAPQPTLHATTPGSYVLQEEADPEADGENAGEGEGEGEPTSYDQVTVSVVPDDPPIGVRIATINADQNHRILIANGEYGGGYGIGYAIVERTTRAVVANGTARANDAGIAELSNLASTYGSGANYMRFLMVIASTEGVPDAQLANFSGLVKKLGGSLLTEENFAALRDGQEFSVIGIPGAPAGAATTRIPGGFSQRVSGSINGYLTKNQAVDAEGTPLYDFNAGAQPNFDTRAPGSSATTNKMVIDNQTYNGSLSGGVTAGFQVVVLESLSLRLLSNETLATNATSGDIRNLQKETGEKIARAVEKPGGPIVFVQTIGKPKAAGPEWQKVVNGLTRVGANPQLVNALNGTSEYALVARNGAVAPPAESSTAFDSGPYPAPNYPPARLVGSLARSRSSNYVPNVFSTPTQANPNGSVNLDLMNIAYQAPKDWPALAPSAAAGEAAAAQKYICEELNFCQPANSCPTVRECFWQRYSADWDAKFTKVGTIGFRDGKGFNEATFKAVKDELATEIEDVANVKSYLKQLQEPFDNSSTRSYVDLKGISDNIYNSLQRPPADNTASWVLGLIGKAASLGGFAGPPVSAAASGLSAAFGLAAYLTNKSGQPILGSEVKVRSDALAGEMLDRIDAARKTTIGLGMLLVSDYGKLTSAYKHVDSDWALPSPDVAANTLRTATKQWFWEALLPTAFPYLIRANSGNARSMDCQLGSRRDAWPNQPDTFQMNAITGYDTNGNPITSDFFFTRGIGGATSPSASIGDELFRPRNGPNPGLGVEKLQFFNARTFHGLVYRAFNNTYACSLRNLPQEF